MAKTDEQLYDLVIATDSGKIAAATNVGYSLKRVRIAQEVFGNLEFGRSELLPDLHANIVRHGVELVLNNVLMRYDEEVYDVQKRAASERRRKHVGFEIGRLQAELSRDTADAESA